MSTYNKRKGATFETDVLKWLRSKKIIAERLTKAGSKDEGDVVIYVNNEPRVLELKATKKIDLPTFWAEATVEASNFAKARALPTTPNSYIILKRRMAGIEKAWVIQSLEQWIERNSE